MSSSPEAVPGSRRPGRRLARAGLAAAASAGLLAGAAAASAAAQASTSRGVVDISTTLAYEDGAAAGTGMILTSSGIVLTNNHVVEGASRIVVADVTTGRRYPATVIGTDSADDVAVLRLKGASGLTPVALGQVARLSVGDPVTTVGNAGGTGGAPTVSSGHVVRLRRSITVSDTSGQRSEHLAGLIQVDASLSPGDSGGALLDGTGRVVGMNTAASVSFRFRARSSEGFAIPMDRALTIAGQIRAGRGSSRVHIGPAARLGVQVVGADQAPGNPPARGAVVAGVASGTPADSVGLSRGDVIVSLGGRRVVSATGLSDLMQQHHPGDQVRVGWIDGNGAARSGIAQLATGPAA